MNPHPAQDALACLDRAEKYDGDLAMAISLAYSTHRDAIRAALQSASREWMPIESAPRDGTRILLCVHGENLDFKKGTVARCIGYFAQKYTLPAHEDVWEPEKFPNEFEYRESSGEWFAKEGFFYDAFENSYGDEISRRLYPTHWQPLPTPPKQGA